MKKNSSKKTDFIPDFIMPTTPFPCVYEVIYKHADGFLKSSVMHLTQKLNMSDLLKTIESSEEMDFKIDQIVILEQIK